MTLEILLVTTIEAALGLLLEAGLGDEIRDLKDRLLDKDAKKRRQALEKAYREAVKAAGEDRLHPLLEDSSFQEAVVTGLLDPLSGFDIQSAGKVWGDKLPSHAPSMRRFFSMLENFLLKDETWGPILVRFQTLRSNEQIQKLLEAQKLYLPTQNLVHQVSNQLIGSGAIVQGEKSIAIGAGGRLINVKIRGDYIAPGGTKIVIPEQRDFAKEQEDKSRRRYLENLRRSCQSLPLAAMGGEEGGEAEITLDQVYVDLDTTTRVELTKAKKQKARQESQLSREPESRPVTALEAGTQHARLVLLGDPGGGKSTFVRYLLAWLAAARLEEPVKPLPADIGLDFLPIFVALRDLVPRLRELDLRLLSDDKLVIKLSQAVCDLVLENAAQQGCEAFKETLENDLFSGSCLLVLDGLDEVPQDLRQQVRQAVAAVLERYKPQRMIVTCRVRSYIGEAVLPNFQAFTLAPFDEEKIQEFVGGWYKAQRDLGRLNVKEAKERADDLAKAALTFGLRELSSNPLLLTTMAIIHQQRIGLPKERVRLYDLAVDVLSQRWQKHKMGEMSPSKALADFLNEKLRLRAVLECLAYEAHGMTKEVEGKKQAADLPRGGALTTLEQRDYLGSMALAGEFLDYVDQRAGLLVGRGGDLSHPTVYSFVHRSFQEYMAGCYLVGLRDVTRFLYDLTDQGDYWSLAVQLGFEELHYNRRGTNTLLDLAYRLAPATQPVDSRTWRALLWSAQIALLVGSETVTSDRVPDGGEAYLQRLIPRLVSLLGRGLPAPERAEAGRVLARLGDPRLEVTALEAMEFCLVPSGSFRMGSQKKDDPDTQDDEKPHEVKLPDYWISLFPVTNAQFNVFVNVGGYGVRKYWKEAQDAKVWQSGKVKGWMDGEPRERPMQFGELFGLPNHPVVGITWYEALAFTRWLTEVWQQQGFLPKGWKVKLPSEAEWEKAARGGLKIPENPVVARINNIAGVEGHTPQQDNPRPYRIYPWEGDFDPDRANIDETGIGSTSAVGCFPGGASPYGVLDMSGNVWEWTRSLYQDYPYDSNDGRENLDSSGGRALRGGAFNVIRLRARCAYRYWDLPDYRYGYGGFRVVVSPAQL